MRFKHTLFLTFSGVFAASVAVAIFVHAASFADAPILHPYEPVSRKEFAKIIMKNTGLKKVYKDKTHPERPIILAEAAAVLVKAFNIKLPRRSELVYTYRKISDDGEQLITEQPKWYKGPIIALGREHAIPPSFVDLRDYVTRSELAEMIYRLKEGVKDREYREFSSTFDFREGIYGGAGLYTEEWMTTTFVRFFGDFRKASFEDSFFPKNYVEQFLQPATYHIDDAEYYDGGFDDQCKQFVTDSVSVTTQGENSKIELRGRSAGFCKAIEKDIPYDDRCAFPQAETGCKCSVGPSGERCNVMGHSPYLLTFIKKGSRVHFEDGETNRIRIRRQPMEKLPFEFGTNGPFYDHTRVETKGPLEVKKMPDGRELFIYKTPWRTIFNDLRGVPFLAIEKDLPDGSVFHKTYYAPEHNRNPYGKGTASYEQCLKDPLSPLKNVIYQFCIKKDGKNLVIASYLELGDRVTLWIDEHFKR